MLLSQWEISIEMELNLLLPITSIFKKPKENLDPSNTLFYITHNYKKMETLVTKFIEMTKQSEQFATELFNHYVNRKSMITNEEASIRIFGKVPADSKDKKESFHNREKIDREINRIRSKDYFDSSNIIEHNYKLCSNNKRNKNVKGFKISYNVYKMICTNLKPEMFCFYLTVESLLFDYFDEIHLYSLKQIHEHGVNSQESSVLSSLEMVD